MQREEEMLYAVPSREFAFRSTSSIRHQRPLRGKRQTSLRFGQSRASTAHGGLGRAGLARQAISRSHLSSKTYGSERYCNSAQAFAGTTSWRGLEDRTSPDRPDVHLK